MLVIAVTHDLNLAAAFADRIVVLDAGRVGADAAPADVLAPEMIGRVFGVESQLFSGPQGRPWITYGG
jgi:iron complex transport system ATP-binding protein